MGQLSFNMSSYYFLHISAFCERKTLGAFYSFDSPFGRPDQPFKVAKVST